MAHHCGFTLKVLIGTLKTNGFAAVAGKRRPSAKNKGVRPKRLA